ncbi:hypothetical protein [Octadecabacter arcticus]|jgi:hypothetical protein|uniref:hypothetical protein n=1 Tax=Octadecabacter arcticus TaxID=53946 RepID=UPI0016511E46|nr:hypothetical protein [Octadecabacter arcticus]
MTDKSQTPDLTITQGAAAHGNCGPHETVIDPAHYGIKRQNHERQQDMRHRNNGGTVAKFFLEEFCSSQA